MTIGRIKPVSDEARLRLETPQPDDDGLTLAASLDDPMGRRHRLWYRVPTEWAGSVTSAADPFVLAFTFPMMQWARPVRVEGCVSPSLLAKLEHFMATWSAWIPRAYRPVTIRAAEEREPAPLTKPGSTVVPFSAGVDSCFTLWRHTQGLLGRRTRRVEAAVMMDGFDITLDQPNARQMYEALLADARRMFQGLGVPLIPMASNFRALPTTWQHSLGTHLMGGLMLLQDRFDHALFPNCIPYTRLYIPWGNHPLSTPLMGGDRFRIADDGGECGRFEKIRLIANWHGAMQHLRVCHENPGSHRNCCRCEKCVRTILSFRAVGLPQPPAFERELTPRDVRRVRFDHLGINTRQITEVIQAGRAHGYGREAWVRAACFARRRNQLRHALKRVNAPFVPVRNLVRTLLRGSPLSRRQRREQRQQSGPSVPHPHQHPS